MTKNKNEDKLVSTELIISSSLRFGVYLAALIIIIGLIAYISTGTTGYPEGTFPITVASVFSGAVQFKSAAIISLGLFILIATPIFRVATSIIMFLIEKDYLYAFLTSFVLLILLLSLILGKAL